MKKCSLCPKRTRRTPINFGGQEYVFCPGCYKASAMSISQAGFMRRVFDLAYFAENHKFLEDEHRELQLEFLEFHRQEVWRNARRRDKKIVDAKFICGLYSQFN